jgi:hypothetical protein
MPHKAGVGGRGGEGFQAERGVYCIGIQKYKAKTDCIQAKEGLTFYIISR